MSRLFDLSSNIKQPEQEYYLEAVEPGKCHNVGSICPVAFSFGGQHLWETFSVRMVLLSTFVVICHIVFLLLLFYIIWCSSFVHHLNSYASSVALCSFSLIDRFLFSLLLQVFVLFSDGSIYVLCPVVPFGRCSFLSL